MPQARKRWALSWELQAVSQALFHTLNPQSQDHSGLPEQLHRARLRVMQGLGPQEADSSRVLREMAAGALRRWGLLRTLQMLMSQRRFAVGGDPNARALSQSHKPWASPAEEPLTPGDCLIRTALSWMIERPETAATVVDQAVDCAKRLVARNVSYTNALLRRFSRERHALLERADHYEEAKWNVPGWWLGALRSAYPSDWQQVLEAAAQPAPVCLRANRRKADPQALAARWAEQGFIARTFDRAAATGVQMHRSVPSLYTADALYLPASTDPTLLAGFNEGLFSVQDLGAQQAAWLMALADGMRVLDACAAPGGKTGHILELVDCELQAWDVSPRRLERVAQNLQRLKAAAKLDCVDLLSSGRLPVPEAYFDRILLDAPCSASGIIGRHPEIRWRRRPEELRLHQSQQEAMLRRLWPLLKPGGRLLFVSCSLFPEEGQSVIDSFLTLHGDAEHEPLAGFSPLLPTRDEYCRYDGFYYARLLKRSP